MNVEPAFYYVLFPPAVAVFLIPSLRRPHSENLQLRLCKAIFWGVCVKVFFIVQVVFLVVGLVYFVDS